MSTLIFFFIILKMYQNHIIRYMSNHMGNIFLFFNSQDHFLSFKPGCLSSALSSICYDDFTCTWFSVSNSHIIFDNCLMGYCHQSDVKIASDN